MKTKYYHYFAVMCFTGAMMALIVFFWTRWTMSIIACFFAMLMAIIYRSEYQFKTILERLR